MRTCALFDFAETIAELNPSRLDILSRYIFENSGVRVDRRDICMAYKVADVSMPYSSIACRTKAQRIAFYAEYNRIVLGFLGVLHLLNPNEMLRYFMEAKSHWCLKEGVFEMLKLLKSHGYNVGILSNFDDILYDIVYNKLDLDGIIDYLYISQVEGVEKPDVKFYSGFMDAYDVDLKRSFYVGDSFFLDFMPCYQLGVKTWLLDECGLYPYLPSRVASIDEIMSFV